MRSRRLLIILVIFIVLAGIAIIGGTVFRVKKIEIVFTNTTSSALNQSEVSSLLQSRLEKDFKGKNILFSLDKAAITKTIEDTNIFLKVTNVKAEFPNRIVVDVRERFPVFFYKEAGDEFVMDAEMRVLYKNDFTGQKNDLTDISFVGSGTTGLLQGIFVKGDYVMGNSESNKEKIDLIAFIPKFFAGTSGYEATMVHQIRGIKFNPTVDGMTTMRVEVQPETHDVQDVRLMIMKAPGEDFIKLFEMVWATMSQKVFYGEGNTETKQAGQAGIYVIYYNDNGKLEVVWYSAPPGTDTDDNGFPNDGIEPDAKFTEAQA